MNKHTITLLLSIIFTLTLVACSDVTTPKPRGYFRISLPQHDYNTYNDPNNQYSFKFSKLASVVHDKDPRADSTWINIFYPTLNCKIHVTYMKLQSTQEQQAYEDSHRLAYKHSIMADAINERYYENKENRVFATLYEIKGNAATPLQFAITDSTGNFFRGSLYFNCHPNKDSLAPISQYINEDITHLIESFNWNNN